MEMHQILGAAKAVPLTMSGDIDNDFASAMSAHHRSAIKIIDILRENGEAPELRALAGRMKAARLTEIEAMAARKDAAPQGKILAKGTRESEGSSELERVMAASMTMPMTMSVSVDRDFASLMTMHHTTALEMIDVLLKYGTSCDMTTLGATMKATHQDELTKLNRYVK